MKLFGALVCLAMMFVCGVLMHSFELYILWGVKFVFYWFRWIDDTH